MAQDQPTNATDTAASILTLRQTLVSDSSPLGSRFRALFSLKHLASTGSPDDKNTLAAIAAIADAFVSPSALLKHELAYCLGQTRNKAAVPYLRGVLEDFNQDAMCRHEAAEGLAALGDEGSLTLLRERLADTQEEVVVRETCEIAIQRIEWETSHQHKEELKSSDFASIDPAPPMPTMAQKGMGIPQLEQRLMDTTLPLFERYRAMFALRDLASPPDLPTAIPAVLALANGFSDKSALFRHEIAFVFGQLTHPASIPSLIRTLENGQEESMVRHEAAEALGSLGDHDGVEDVLRRFLNDPEQVVRESIVVALDMADFESKGEKEYATIPQAVAV